MSNVFQDINDKYSPESIPDLITFWSDLGFMSTFEKQRNAVLGMELLKEWMLLESNKGRINKVKEDRYFIMIPHILQKYPEDVPPSTIMELVIFLCATNEFPSEMFQNVSTHLPFEEEERLMNEEVMNWADNYIKKLNK